jgi:hypothetical protein
MPAACCAAEAFAVCTPGIRTAGVTFWQGAAVVGGHRRSIPRPARAVTLWNAASIQINDLCVEAMRLDKRGQNYLAGVISAAILIGLG